VRSGKASSVGYCPAISAGPRRQWATKPRGVDCQRSVVSRGPKGIAVIGEHRRECSPMDNVGQFGRGRGTTSELRHVAACHDGASKPSSNMTLPFASSPASQNY